MRTHSERIADAEQAHSERYASISISNTISQEALQEGSDVQRELLLGEEVGTELPPPGEHPPVRVDWLDVLPPEADCLRDYQREQLAELAVALHRGDLRILLQLPTGAGKTHLIAAIVAAAVLAGMRVLVLATRTRLVRQIHERLIEFGVNHGVVAAPLPELRNYDALAQVASVDTLHRRAVVNGRMPLPGADVVIFDEAHLSAATTRTNILNSYPQAIRIGLTATPARKSGRGLGNVFERILCGPSIRELVGAERLVPVRIFNTPVVSSKELSALPRDVDNDFASGALGEILSRPKLIGDVVENWLRIANRKRTLVFAVNKAHAAALLDSFSCQGVAAEMLTDQDDEATREEVIRRLESGKTHVLVNCFLLSYGTDLPAVECIVLARPTRSLTMYLQMVGRGMRPAPGKSHCIVIDHGHVVETLGLPHADREWTLDARRNVNSETLSRHRKGLTTAEQARTCTQCSTLWLTSEEGNACPSCGWTPATKSKAIGVQQADLEEMAESEMVTPQSAVVERFYCEAMTWDAIRSPDKWVGFDPQSGKSRANSRRFVTWLRTCERFWSGEKKPMPRYFWQLSAAPCSEANAGWLLSRQIRFARSRRRAA